MAYENGIIDGETQLMQSPRNRGWSRVSRYLLPCLAAGITVIGARLWLISRYATSLPINDQWPGEGFYLLKPWYEGRLSFSDLFNPHNEHRIFFSRLLTIALTYANGQWDSLPEMAFDAVFAGVMAALVLATLFSILKGRFRDVSAVTVTLWLALPYAHENTLWGFQSSFYFLLFFSLMGIWGLTLHPPWSLGWWFGAAGAVCACLSMGSGLLAAFAVALLLVTQTISRQRPVRDAIPTLCLAAVIVLIATYFRTTVPQHVVYQAHSVSAGLTFFGRCLAWPWSNQPFAALIGYAPFLWFVTREGRHTKKGPPDKSTQLLIALGIWVILQSAALAYSRGGAGDGSIPSRYLDILGLGVAVNVLALCLLLSQEDQRPSRLPIRLAGAGWLVASLAFTAVASYREVQGQYKRQDYLQNAERAVRGYLATKDRHYLEGEPHPVPYPDIEAISRFLDDKTIQALLPASARLPLPLEKNARSDQSFTQPGCAPGIETPPFEKSWGSYSTGGVAALGEMETKIVRARLPYLEFEVAGGLGPEMSLSVKTGATLTKVRWLQPYPTDASRPQWRLAYSALARDEVEISARDNSPEEWFAFREPREMGRLSYYSHRLVQSGKVICLSGFAVCFVFLLTTVLPFAAFKSFHPPRERS